MPREEASWWGLTCYSLTKGNHCRIISFKLSILMQGSVSANHLNNFSDRFSLQDERFRRKAEQQHLALILKSYQESAKPILTELFLFRHTANCLLWRKKQTATWYVFVILGVSWYFYLTNFLDCWGKCNQEHNQGPFTGGTTCNAYYTSREVLTIV